MEKELGFFTDNIEPRDFNKLEINLNIVTKRSNNLSGEIYYYKNIPTSLKDLFPSLIDYSPDKTWFKIEQISGLVLSNLYLSELLKENTLIEVMNSIQRLHTTPAPTFIDTNINIYENYSNKLKERFENYDYSKFYNSKKKFDFLLNKLTVYENENKGKKGIIHGDPVFTNIIIDNYENIKFIDMRGKVGKTLTIYGDKMYDWAKLYQSLIGYDCILLDKTINQEYKIKLINVFKKYFLNLYTSEDFENIKLITNSLLFTLLPLHDNEKCFKYYDLIDTF
jgi:tRNA A-37 threonylcarbamoyl transferase component Bud32